MTGCGPQLGVLLLLAVLLQTVVVTITVLHFTAALNTVSLQLSKASSPLARSRAKRSLSLARGALQLQTSSLGAEPPFCCCHIKLVLLRVL